MEFKRIIVLANSIKKGDRCIAGREVGNDSAVGSWIRPISEESEGELRPWHMRVHDEYPVEVLDILDVPLSRYAEDVIHPEDWIVQTDERWRRRTRLNRQQLPSLEERPKDLWLESTSGTDRVAGAFLSRRSNHQSLYLIRPTDFRVELSFKHNQYKNKEQKRTRSGFSYNGQRYWMNLTDPEFTHRHCTSYPELGAPASVVRPPYGDHCLLCVSLTPEFNGYHYKVVATVLELA